MPDIHKARHGQVIEEIVAVDDACAHVLRAVVGAVQRPQQRRVRRPVPPVLGHVVADKQNRSHGVPWQPSPRVLIFRRPSQSSLLHQPENERLGESGQQRDAQHVEDIVAAAGVHATGFSENEFEQDEAGEQREKQYVLEVGHQVPRR